MIRCLLIAVIALLAVQGVTYAQTPHWLLDAQNDQRFSGGMGNQGTVQLWNHPGSGVTIYVERVTCNAEVGNPDSLGYVSYVGTARPTQYWWTSSQGRYGHGQIQSGPWYEDAGFIRLGPMLIGAAPTIWSELGVRLVPGQGLAVYSYTPWQVFYCHFQGSEK